MQTCSFNTAGRAGSAQILSRGSFVASPAFLPLSYTSVRIIMLLMGTVMRLTRFARFKLFSSLSHDTALLETQSVPRAELYFNLRAGGASSKRAINVLNVPSTLSAMANFT